MSSLNHENLALAPPLAPILGKRAPPDADPRSAAAGAPPSVRLSSATSVHARQVQPFFSDGIEEPEAVKDDEDKMEEENDDADDDAGSQTSATSAFGGTRHEFDEMIAELEGASPGSSPGSPFSPVSVGSRMSPTSPLPWTSTLAPVDTTPWHQLEGHMWHPFSA